MQNLIAVTGMVIKTAPVGEYDRRVVILTKERGKISTFAKGSRRQNSKLLAAANPLSFGRFGLMEGKTSYNIVEAEITNYFETLREDLSKTCYATYLLEIADYYSRENNDEVELLKLLYQSMRALEAEALDNRLVRVIYEIKAICVNGEYPGIPDTIVLTESAEYTLSYIIQSRIEKLYTFAVTEEVLFELKALSDYYRNHLWDRHFKSLDILETIEEFPC